MNPNRTVFINHSNQKLLLRLKMDILLDKLIITYEIHQLLKNNIAPQIVLTLQNDPEANIIDSETIPTKLAYTSQLNLGQINQDFPNIRNLMNEYSKKPEELIKATFFGSTLWITYDNLFTIYSFLKSYIGNYDVIKMKLLTPPESKKEEEENNTEVNKEIIQEKVIKEILKLSPDKIVNYQIIKWLNSNKVFGEVDHSEENILLKINHPFDFDYLLYSDDNIDLMNQLLMFVDLDDREDNIFKIKTLYRYLYNVVDGIKSDNQIISQDEYIQLQVITFLLFLYGCRILYPTSSISKTTNLDNVYSLVINKCIESISVNNENKLIIVQFMKLLEDDTVKKLDIGEVSEEYKYLIKVDPDIFIEKVSERIKYTSPEEINIEPKKYINSPNIININDFFDNSKTALMSYTRIKEDIISKPYQDILLLESGKKLKQIDPIVSKFSDIIINHIFKEINDDTCVDTLDIMINLIDPNVPKDTTERTRQYIMYQIIIPHIYNLYGTEKFIDYFH